MANSITTIHLSLPLRIGQVNAYLISTAGGHVLIDTGLASSRQLMVRELQNAGCRPGHLALIVLTHGDFDHSGNAAYLRDAFASQVAMHPDDAGMVERGDMFVNRKQPNILIRTLLPRLTGFGRAECFKPDVLLADGDDLAPYGLPARVLSIPGHSRGSVAILTAGGDLFCGDILENTKRPAPGSLIDDQPAAQASLRRLQGLAIHMVYPGHGQPFPMDQLSTSGS